MSGSFNTGDAVVYPAHGVGHITGIETQQIAECELKVYVINFNQDRMTLRLPVAKANSAGLRRLSSGSKLDNAFKTLKMRGRISRAMWSRRAQEYEAKINSGDPVSIAEVVRDLHRNTEQPEQSYSERQIYQAAIRRLAREIAAVESIEENLAINRVEETLAAN
jgi:CarD family transcriptional regulator